MTLSRIDLSENAYPSQFINTTFNSTYFNYDRDEDEELSLIYGGDVSALDITPQNMFKCSVNGWNFTGAFYLLGPIPSDPSLKVVNRTSIVTVPMFRTVGKMLYTNQITLREALMEGFSVKYYAPYDVCSECIRLGGKCGFNVVSAQPVCLCGEMHCTLPPEHSHENSSQGTENLRL